MRLRPHRAGRHARDTWRANRRVAFRAAWRLNLLSAGLFAGCVLGIVFTQGFGQLLFAATIGSLLTIHAVMWTLGGHVDQLRWLRGSWGEEATEDELNKLGRTWRIEHGIWRERGDWDHVAVSCCGVFALESKWTSSKARVVGDELRLGRVPYQGASFRRAAVELRDRLASADGTAPWVTAVVVIWGDFEQALVQGDRVTFVSGPRLADWLREQPARFSEARAQRIADLVHELARQNSEGGVRRELTPHDQYK